MHNYLELKYAICGLRQGMGSQCRHVKSMQAGKFHQI